MSIHTRPVAPVTLHDPQDWTFLFQQTTVDGFGEGDAISITKPADIVKPKVGAMGEVAIAIARNPIHALEINLHQTSAANATLTGLYYAQLSNPDTAVGYLSCENRRTGVKYEGIGWLVQDADEKVSGEVQNRTWKFGFVQVENPAGR